MYLGNIDYKGVNFNFAFNGEKLTLCPKAGNEEDAWTLVDPNEEYDDFFTDTLPLIMDDMHLLLDADNFNVQLVLFTEGCFVCTRKCTNINFSLNVYCYFELTENAQVERIEFKSKLLNYIYDIQSLKKSIKRESQESEAVKAVLLAAKSTDLGTFEVDGREIAVSSENTLSTISKVGCFPVGGDTSLYFTFSPTDNYVFLDKLIRYAREFLSFCSLCYDVEYDAIVFQASDSISIKKGDDDISAPYFYDVGKRLPVKSQTEIPQMFDEGKFIPINENSDFVSTLLSAARDDKLYIEHLAHEFSKVRYYDLSRLIFIVIGFEWEFYQNFPNGIKHSTQHYKTVELIENAFEDAKKKYRPNSRQRREMKRLLKIAREDDSFSAKMRAVAERYPTLLEGIGNWHYKHYDRLYILEDTAKRLQGFRNAFAHGNVYFEYDEKLHQDVMFLERVMFALQLLRLKYGDEEAVLAQIKRIY